MAENKDTRESEGSSNDQQGLNVEHHDTVVDHRDVIEVTVKAMLDGNRELLTRAAGLVYNISMAKVNNSRLTILSAIRTTVIVYSPLLPPAKQAQQFSHVMQVFPCL